VVIAETPFGKANGGRRAWSFAEHVGLQLAGNIEERLCSMALVEVICPHCQHRGFVSGNALSRVLHRHLRPRPNGARRPVCRSTRLIQADARSDLSPLRCDFHNLGGQYAQSNDEPELFHLFAFGQQAREPDPNTCLPSLVLRASGEWLGCRHAAGEK
jgi:hypothetical protein